MLTILLFVGVAMAFRHPPDEMTINQGIQEAATSSESMEFIQDNSTVMVDLDMLMTLEDYEDYYGEDSGGRQKRKAIRGNRWTGNTIVYDPIPFSGRDRSTILAAFEQYHQWTCIKFRQASGQRAKIYFTDGRGCSSYVGMLGNRQPVTLARGCRTRGIVMHELGHAAGLHHEQTRQDRDRFISINFQNIHSNMAFNFKKNNVIDLGVPYSYLSIMHYDQYAFSKNGRKTMIAKNSAYQNRMGNRNGFDFADIKILNLMYNCASHCGRKSCPGDGFLGKDCKCWCRGNPVQECGSGGRVGGSSSGGGGSTGGSTGGGCQDTDSNCQPWSRSGYCRNSKYQQWMKTNCPRSCGYCSRFYSAMDACRDQFHSCGTWAANGECERNPAYMNSACAGSCNTCIKSYTKINCMDAKPACAALAQKGMCDKNQEYMHVTCAKSCNPLCQG